MESTEVPGRATDPADEFLADNESHKKMALHVRYLESTTTLDDQSDDHPVI